MNEQPETVTITTETHMTPRQYDDNAMQLFLIIEGAIQSDAYSDSERDIALSMLDARLGRLPPANS